MKTKHGEAPPVHCPDLYLKVLRHIYGSEIMWPTVKTVVRRLIRNTTFQRGRHSKLHPNEFLLKTDAEWAENKHTAVRWHTTDSAMRAVLIECIRKHKLNEAFKAYKVRVAKRESEQSPPIQPPSTVNAVRSTIAGQVPSSPVTLDASIEALVEAKVEEKLQAQRQEMQKIQDAAEIQEAKIVALEEGQEDHQQAFGKVSKMLDTLMTRQSALLLTQGSATCPPDGQTSVTPSPPPPIEETTEEKLPAPPVNVLGDLDPSVWQHCFSKDNTPYYFNRQSNKSYWAFPGLPGFGRNSARPQDPVNLKYKPYSN